MPYKQALLHVYKRMGREAAADWVANVTLSDAQRIDRGRMMRAAEELSRRVEEQSAEEIVEGPQRPRSSGTGRTLLRFHGVTGRDCLWPSVVTTVVETWA